jgi:hypothetical protein
MFSDNFTNGTVHGARGHTVPLGVPGTHFKIFLFLFPFLEQARALGAECIRDPRDIFQSPIQI